MLIPLNMYLREPDKPQPDNISIGLVPNVLSAGFMLITIYLGLFFQPLADFAKNSAVIFGTILH
jgi:NADH-quinone oxidoreductase subunit N